MMLPTFILNTLRMVWFKAVLIYLGLLVDTISYYFDFVKDWVIFAILYRSIDKYCLLLQGTGELSDLQLILFSVYMQIYFLPFRGPTCPPALHLPHLPRGHEGHLLR